MKNRRANDAFVDTTAGPIASDDRVLRLRQGSHPDTARVFRLENDLRLALGSNRNLAEAASRPIHVIGNGSGGKPEAVVGIARYGQRRLVGHAFHDVEAGIAYALIALAHWPEQCGNAAAFIARYRHGVMTEHRFAPVYALGESDTFVEAPNAVAAIQRLADMIRRVDPRIAVLDQYDRTESYIDIRVVSAYWNPEPLIREGG